MKPGPELCATAYRIAQMQTPTGAIPWEQGRHVDPWDHVEAAMALDAFGHASGAEAAYAWLRRMQASDGAWAAAYEAEVAVDRTVDANFCAYVAVGVWHHYLCTRDARFLRSMWPVVERALDLVVAMQMASGAIMWARDAAYRPWPGALLTSSSCIFLSLRCAVTIAEHVGEERPDWELALARLGDAIERGELFEPKDAFAMDWYYPVLGGAISGDTARARLQERWDEFVIEGRGVRCVSHRDWVTAGETGELALACWSAGMDHRARELLAWLDHLRTRDGLYWTGANHPNGDVYPLEATSWSAGAVLLAADAILRSGPTAMLFSGRSLVPAHLFTMEVEGAPGPTTGGDD